MLRRNTTISSLKFSENRK